MSYGRHMSLSIAMVTLDCREPVALATWWRQLLGTEVALVLAARRTEVGRRGVSELCRVRSIDPGGNESCVAPA